MDKRPRAPAGRNATHRRVIPTAKPPMEFRNDAVAWRILTSWSDGERPGAIAPDLRQSTQMGYGCEDGVSTSDATSPPASAADSRSASQAAANRPS